MAIVSQVAIKMENNSNIPNLNIPKDLYEDLSKLVEESNNLVIWGTKTPPPPHKSLIRINGNSLQEKLLWERQHNRMLLDQEIELRKEIQELQTELSLYKRSTDMYLEQLEDENTPSFKKLKNLVKNQKVEITNLITTVMKLRSKIISPENGTDK